MTIPSKTLDIHLKRSADVRRNTSHPTVANTYDRILAGPGDAFATAVAGEAVAYAAWGDARTAAIAALRLAEPAFLAARAIVGANAPSYEQPPTLRSCTTDTERLLAMKTLLDFVHTHAGTPWADELLSGELATTAAVAIEKITAAVDAAKAYYDAADARRAAVEPAYRAFLAFKEVVRAREGRTSRNYRQIASRKPIVTDTPEPPVVVPGPSEATATATAPSAPAVDAAPAPSNGAGAH